jgi:hypothetical protein
VTSSVTSGIATRLAAKPTTETCWKNSIDSGASPSVAIHCARRPACAARQTRRPGDGDCGAAERGASPAASSSATAPKLSQKPGCSRAQGSSSVTATAATSITAGQRQTRPALRSSTAQASISSVRWAGTPKPASSA